MKIHALVGSMLIWLVTACAPVVGVSVSPSASGAVPDYDRDRFGDGWADIDGDCQDTRNEILIRDLVDEQLDAEGCKVLAGVLHDAYTGSTIEFRRGQTTSDDVQIDHLVPLAYAWRAGASAWTDQQREAFANDPAELRAVDGPTNNAKRDRGPSRWLPPNPAVHCEYAAAWSSITSTYALILDQADVDTIDRILGGC
jgi:Protein of unknown function (DUF1524)